MRSGEEHGTKCIADIISCLVSDTQGPRCKLNLQLLLILFNLVSLDAHKYAAIMAVLQYALDTRQAACVSRIHSRVAQWAKAWVLTVSQKSALYLLIRNVLESSPNTANTADSKSFFMQYISCFPTDAALPKDAAERCTVAIVDCIQSPAAAFGERAAFLQTVTAAHVQGHAKLQSLRELLTVICEGNLATFQSFAAKTQLSTLNLDAASLESNMRLLALCAGAVTKEKMTYGEIAAAMQVPVDDVEIWVVTAIAQGVLEGTLDQTTSTLTIARCSYRSFGVEQWKDVQKKLTQLRQHIASVFDEMNRK